MSEDTGTIRGVEFTIGRGPPMLQVRSLFRALIRRAFRPRLVLVLTNVPCHVRLPRVADVALRLRAGIECPALRWKMCLKMSVEVGSTLPDVCTGCQVSRQNMIIMMGRRSVQETDGHAYR